MIRSIARQRWLLPYASIISLVCFSFLYDAHREAPLLRWMRENDIALSAADSEECYPQEPEKENGAFLYLLAFDELRQPDFSVEKDLPFSGKAEHAYGQEFSPEQIEIIHAHVTENESALAQVLAAQEKPFCRLPLEGYDEQYAFYRDSSTQLGRLVAHAILDASLSGDSDRVARMGEVGLHLYELYSEGTTHIDVSTAQWFLKVVFDSLELSICNTRPSTDALRQWVASLEDVWYVSLYPLKNEIRKKVTSILPLLTFDSPLFPPHKGYFGIVSLRQWWHDWVQLNYGPQMSFIRLMNFRMRAVDSDIYDVLVKERASFDEYGLGVYERLDRLLWPWAIYGKHAEHLARSVVMRSAFAALLYQEDHGRLPDSLGDLVPEYLSEIPRDPFTPDSAIRYRIRDDLAVFYSIGPNEQDDGGTEPVYWLARGGDIIFRLPLMEGKHDES